MTHRIRNMHKYENQNAYILLPFDSCKPPWRFLRLLNQDRYGRPRSQARSYTTTKSNQRLKNRSIWHICCPPRRIKTRKKNPFYSLPLADGMRGEPTITVPASSCGGRCLPATSSRSRLEAAVPLLVVQEVGRSRGRTATWYSRSMDAGHLLLTGSEGGCRSCWSWLLACRDSWSWGKRPPRW